ncbi:type IV secretion protein Rhs [Brucella intermedia]|nr:type IV secretion protein Rhs [Brucella intermedia]
MASKLPDLPKVPAAVQPIVGDPKLQNLMDNIYKGTNNPNRVGDGTLADAVRYEKATGGTVGGRTHTIKAEETIRGLQNWLDRNPHALQVDRQEAITQIQNLQKALDS